MAVQFLGREPRNVPAVSVIIPVLNTRPYLEQCLESLMAQTLQEIEVICVDNGSTDGSYTFLKDYAEHRANFIVIRHPKGRQGDARNAGIERATGQYIGFVDSDDFVSPDMFRAMYDAAQRNQAEAVICNIELYYEDDGGGGQMLPSDLLEADEPLLIQQRPRLLRNLTICNKLFSRELIDRHQLRFPEGVFHEDQFFVIVALALAQRITTVSDPLYFYRRGRPGSVNECRGDDSLQLFRVMQMVSDFFEDRDIDDSLNSLIREVQVLKCLETYRLTGQEFRREYFWRMKKWFQSTHLELPPMILSSSQRREYRVVQCSEFLQYELFLLLRSLYGSLRRCVTRLGVLGSPGQSP